MTNDVLPILIAALVGFSTGVAVAQDRGKCERALSKAIKDVGLSMGDIHTRYWQLESANNGAESWKFSGQPKSCYSGRLIVNFAPLCSDLRIFTTGECRVEGLIRR